jgi:serralysin
MTTLTIGDFAPFTTLVFAFEDQLAPPSFGDPTISATDDVYAARLRLGGESRFLGQGFTFDVAGHLSSGVVTDWEDLGPNYEGTPAGQVYFSLGGLSLAGATLSDWLFSGGVDPPARSAAGVLFAGADSIAGGALGDALWGGGGDDTISGGGGDDIIGGDAGKSYLRGGEGNDQINGGDEFDDINGNAGDDTAQGAGGADWVVGGRGDDLLHGGYGEDYDDEQRGDAGDIVLGNLGNDTCDGGAAADTVRGGQGDDSLTGGRGDDWLSGDLGSDTVSGGAGADVFHSFGDASLDRVTDFNRAEGDRVQLDVGTTYAVSQQGADVMIDMGGGGRVVLVGVQLSTLSGDWIVAV